MIGIYRETFAALRANIWFFVAIAVLFLIVDWLDTSIGVELAPMVFLAYALHRHFLFGESLSTVKHPVSAQKPAMGRFFFVALLVIGVPVLLAILMLTTVLAPVLRDLDDRGNTAILLLVFVSTYGVFLIAFGTALPAAAAGEPVATCFSLQRSRRTALGIAGGLLAGPVLIGIINLTIVAILVYRYQFDIDLSNDRPLVPGEVALSLFTEMLALIQTTLATVVLCHAYRKVTPRPPDERIAEVFG